MVSNIRVKKVSPSFSHIREIVGRYRVQGDPVIRTCVAFVIVMVPGGAVIRDTGDNFQIMRAAVIYENGGQ